MNGLTIATLYLCIQPGVELSKVDVYQPDGSIKTVQPNDTIGCPRGSRIVLRTEGEYKWNIITTNNEVVTLGRISSIQFTVPEDADTEESFLYIDAAKAWPAMECNLVLKGSQGWARNIQPVLNSNENLELSFNVQDSSYIYKVRKYGVNGDVKTYKISDTISCVPGDKITLCHSSNKNWVVNSPYAVDNHMDLGMDTFCSFTVPAKVFGAKAKLLTGSTKNYDYLALNRSIGWICGVNPQIGI